MTTMQVAGIETTWEDLIAVLRAEADEQPALMAERIASDTEGDPFRILVAVMLSARARDEVTEQVAHDLFAAATTPAEIAAMTQEELEDHIRSVGTYRQKAERLKETARIIHEDYSDRVPDTMDELLQLPGVGRKTANLVLIRAFDKPGISVDTHVHRLSNAWGIVNTNTPEQTEKALRTVLPKRYWKEWNRLLVTWGKFICPPNRSDTSLCTDHLRTTLKAQKAEQ